MSAIERPDGIAATRSHSPAFNPSRTNPRRSGRQTNSSGRWSWSAIGSRSFLETVSGGIGVGKIVRIGADPQGICSSDRALGAVIAGRIAARA